MTSDIDFEYAPKPKVPRQERDTESYTLESKYPVDGDREKIIE